MTWTQQRMETSAPGLHSLHRRIRSSRCSSASSLSWSGSCSLSQSKSHSNQGMQVTCLQYHPLQRNRQQVPLGQILAFPYHLGCTLEIQHLGFHQGPSSHCYLALQGNNHHHTRAIPCQQCQPHPCCLTGRHPLQKHSLSTPGLPQSAPACQARG